MNQPQNIPLRITYTNGKDQIRFVNQVFISQIDMDVVLDLAVVDPTQVMEINHRIQTGNAQSGDALDAMVFQRIGMSISSFVKFKQQIDQIVQNLENQGVLVKKQDEPNIYQ